MLFSIHDKVQSETQQQLDKTYRMDETLCIDQLIPQAQFSSDALSRIQNQAEKWVSAVRQTRKQGGVLDAFLAEYDLSSSEGIALMSLAESFLRIPDKNTVRELLRDKMASADWNAHRGKSNSVFINAATWGLIITGKILQPSDPKLQTAFLWEQLRKVLQKAGEPIIHAATTKAMQLLSDQFVMGKNIKDALERANTQTHQGYRHSFDMLGEAARTQADADRYYAAYEEAIRVIGENGPYRNSRQAPGVSVKISAIHPRYEFSKAAFVLPTITERIFKLALLAKHYGIGFTLDAEESDRLAISLEIVEAILEKKAFEDWDGFGLAVQAYQKRALLVLDHLINLGRKYQQKLQIRLVKGAYWDSEIKRAQEQGVSSYPVFTRKISTDVSYLACARKMIAASDVIYPKFATHNAYTAAAILEMMGASRDFEFQCLHGMGYTLYDHIVGKENLDLPCRVYAPVGDYGDLLSYLVRRLLENGANNSFVNQILSDENSIQDLIQDPVTTLRKCIHKPHPDIPLPLNIYGTRMNSQGLDITNRLELETLDTLLDAVSKKIHHVTSSFAFTASSAQQEKLPVRNPNHLEDIVGYFENATSEDIANALPMACAAFEKWSNESVEHRAQCLEQTAKLLQKHRSEFLDLLIREAGKTLQDAVSEVREAIDFCYYYAQEARLQLAEPFELKGVTGETNHLSLHGRGVLVCISPWNFPLAIFLGQVTAALVTGNCVIAKPAEPTPLIANRAVELLYEAGIPRDVLQLIFGKGSTIGKTLLTDERVAGVIFTGSTDTAQTINQTLAARKGPLATVIAETGGMNTMIVDSSALAEQVIGDAILSAFGSAGQRCSALRVLYLQDDVADKMITMLKGAMAELVIDDSSKLHTDIGPLINASAKQSMQAHYEYLQQNATFIAQVPLPETVAAKGHFFAPCAFEIKSIRELKQEVFGPILHIIRYRKSDLDQILKEITATGYGLTLGIQTRISSTVEYIRQRVRVGNIYVNRSMIGAVVGVQPFGGEGLSGTGPKAGGPHYLLRLCTERTLTVNTTAAGGNATLMSLNEDI